MNTITLSRTKGRLRRAVAAVAGTVLTVGLVVVAGAGPAAAAPHNMKIDATGLSSNQMNIVNPDGTTTAGVWTTSVLTLSLQEGIYSFNNGGAFYDCSPSVTAAGTWSIPSSCGAAASGNGTSTLTMTGLPITLDTTALSTGVVPLVYGNPLVPVGTAGTLMLMPQSSFQMVVGSAIVTSCRFGLATSGLASVIGCGTSASASGSKVTFTGFPVALDARNLSTTSYVVTDAFMPPNVWTSSTVVQHYRVLAAPWYGFQVGSALVATFYWGVSDTGTMTYPSSFSTFLAGAGTTTLVVNGLAVNVKTTDLHGAPYTLGPDVAGPPFSSSVVQSLHLVPAPYEFWTGDNNPPVFQWVVNNDGTVGFSPGNPHPCAWTTGPNTLLVVECTFTTGSGTPNPSTGRSFRITSLECSRIANVHATGTITFTDVTTGATLGVVTLTPSPVYANCSVAYFTDTEVLRPGSYVIQTAYTPGGSTPILPNYPRQYTQVVNAS